jgi:hypothetical protein
MRDDILRCLFRTRRSVTRRGYGPSRRARRQLEGSEPARGEPIRRRCDWEGPAPALNVRLLYRFLLSRLGRPWDGVMSELSRAVRSPRHRGEVREAALCLVETSAREAGGRPTDSRGGPLPATLRLGEMRLGRCLYVCPSTGLLRQVAEAAAEARPAG